MVRALALPVVAMLAPSASWAQERCEPAAARVVSVQGTVELQPAGGTAWTVARLDRTLCLGDTVRVGRASRAALVLANDSLLRLDQRTTLVLRGLAEERGSLLDLLFGAVYFFSHQPRALALDTPFVNAAAEGTEFLVRVADDRAEVIMLDGQVLLQNPEGELRLVKGDAGVARAGAAPAPMIVARPRDAVAWALYYPPVLAALAGRQARLGALPPGLQAAIDAVAANDYPGALDALDAVPEAARDARYWTYRAGVLLNVGRVEEARTAIARALAIDPEAGDALAQRAIIAIVQNRPADALADARRAVELSPESGAAAVALSYALQANFRLEDAREVLRQASERAPEDALVWARLAEVELMFGDLGAARRAAEQAVALAPDLARTQMVLGFAALTRIDIDQAKAAFERAIALDSAEPLARLGLGLAIIRSGDLDAGAREIEIAAGLDPNDSLIRSYLGKAYFEEKRGPLDAEQFAIAKELDPNDPTPWFYDAIRLQTVNRPVEALRNLERSIALNENRAVYRSRLLLDEDQATRGTSLARIYDDLGFRQLGINEASKSLTLDPGSTSAHRFLSDTYLGANRHEISRVSELLQAQLLQPININPVQPSLSETNLNIVTRGGPAEAGFNEFTPLFERQDTQLNATGIAGNNETYGGEGVVSMLYDRYALSGGAFHFQTDGWRPNNDINHNVYDVYFQAAITPELNAQVEFRRRDSDEGDLAFNFDPDDFSKDDRRDLDQNIGRTGLRYSPTPNSDLLLSFIYSDRDERISDVVDGIRRDNEVEDEGSQLETQYLFRRNAFNLIAGFAYAGVDRVTRVAVPEFNFEGPPTHSNIEQPRGYAYGNINLPDPVTWTVGIGVDHYDQEALDVTKVNPKLGVQWQVAEDLHLRAAAFRTVKPALVTNRTIEPTQIAGFNQFFDDINATEAWRYGAGLDWRLMDGLFVGGEITWRDLKVPLIDGNDTITEDMDEQTHRAYVFWAPLPVLALSAEFIYDRLQAEEGRFTDRTALSFPEDLETVSTPLSLRYFHPSGVFATFGATYVAQQVKRSPASTLAEGDDSFILLDASVGYRLPKRFGIVSLGISNLLDEKFKYQDDSFRQFQDAPSVGPYIPDRTFFGRVTLSW